MSAASRQVENMARTIGELRAERDAAVQVRDQFVMKADECLARALAAEQAAEQAERMRLTAMEDANRADDRAEAAEQAAEQARAALQRFGQHLAGCELAETRTGLCTCGLDAALAGNQP